MTQHVKRIKFGKRSVLIERHERDCSCSYCTEKGGYWMGYWVPPEKAWNSWWVLNFRRFYIRWTGGQKYCPHDAWRIIYVDEINAAGCRSICWKCGKRSQVLMEVSK